MSLPNNTLSTKSPTREQFLQELQRFKEEYEEILLLKDQQLQIKEETIAACRQEINYLRNMVDGLLKQPTVAELVSTADTIKTYLEQSQVQITSWFRYE